MEEFSKQQLILLMMLVAFVSSIVTGITTVSLIAQDPRGITQTINRVVERTIERVVDPETTVTASVATPVQTREVTVVVKEEELVTKAVQEARNSIVRIKNKRDGALLGIGVVINSEGIIVADQNTIGVFREYTGIYQDTSYELVIDKQDRKNNVITFKFKDGIPPNLNPIEIGKSDAILAGQSVVAISGADRDTVSIGIVSSIIKTNDETNTVYAINTTISQDALLSGTPIMNLDGEAIALKIGKDKNENDILMPMSHVLALVAALASTP